MSTHNIPLTSAEYLSFKEEITKRIRSAQYEALKAVNKEMITLYWEIGRRITEQQKALGWGKSVVENLSQDIQKEFPGIKGFGVSNMWDMARFYAEYQSNEILQPLVGEISWSKHIVILTKCKETQQREFGPGKACVGIIEICMAVRKIQPQAADGDLTGGLKFFFYFFF